MRTKTLRSLKPLEQCGWTDETKMELFGHQQRRYVCLEKEGEAFVEKKILPTVKHGGGSIVLWGCVAAGVTGNIVRVAGRMDSTKYEEILDPNVQRSVQTLRLKRGWVFQLLRHAGEGCQRPAR